MEWTQVTREQFENFPGSCCPQFHGARFNAYPGSPEIALRECLRKAESPDACDFTRCNPLRGFRSDQ